MMYPVSPPSWLLRPHELQGPQGRDLTEQRPPVRADCGGDACTRVAPPGRGAPPLPSSSFALIGHRAVERPHLHTALNGARGGSLERGPSHEGGSRGGVIPPVVLLGECGPPRRDRLIDPLIDRRRARPPAAPLLVPALLVGRPLCGVSLCGVSLCGVSLCGVSLCGVSLCGVSLCGVSLRGVVGVDARQVARRLQYLVDAGAGDGPRRLAVVPRKQPRLVEAGLGAVGGRAAAVLAVRRRAAHVPERLVVEELPALLPRARAQRLLEHDLQLEHDVAQPVDLAAVGVRVRVRASVRGAGAGEREGEGAGAGCRRSEDVAWSRA